MTSVSSEATGPAAPTDAGFGRRICLQVERTVDVPMDRVWVVLRDYRAARPRMLAERIAEYAVQQHEGERTVIDYRLRGRLPPAALHLRRRGADGGPSVARA